MTSIDDQVFIQVRDRVLNQFANLVQVRSPFYNLVYVPISIQVFNQVRDRVLNQVRGQVWNQVRGQVKDQFEKKS